MWQPTINKQNPGRSWLRMSDFLSKILANAAIYFGQVPDPEKTSSRPFTNHSRLMCLRTCCNSVWVTCSRQYASLQYFCNARCIVWIRFRDWIIKPHYKVCLIIPSCHALCCCEKDLFTQLPRAKNSRKGVFNQWKLHTQSAYGNVFHWDGLTDRITDYNDSQQNSS